MLIAEFTNGGKRSAPTLTINRLANGRRTFVSSQPVSGKREAREAAKAADAKCWNF